MANDEEELQIMKKVFDEFDANHDGKLTKVEILRGVMSNDNVRNLLNDHPIYNALLHPSTYAQEFDDLDTNHNGYVTMEEFHAFGHRIANNNNNNENNLNSGGSQINEEKIHEIHLSLPERPPTRRLGKDDVATPQDVLYVAENMLGIKPDSEPHLLWIAQDALNTPLPPDWQFEWNAAEGRELYRNTFTDQFSVNHPGDRGSRRIVEQQRATTMPGAVALDGAWMKFYDLDGIQYFYSFTDDIRRARKPSAAILIERPADFLEMFNENDDNDVDEQGSNASALMWKSITQVKSISNIDVMEFKSWWSESKPGFDKGSERRYVEIRFIIDTGNFQILLDKSDKMYTLSHIQGLHGPLQCWDLHVGARINVLGRSTTLMQTSGSTLEWLEKHGNRLSKIKSKLEKEISKYDRRLSKSFTAPRKKATVMRGGQKHGTKCLRTLMLDIEKRRVALSKYRPKLADKICGIPRQQQSNTFDD